METDSELLRRFANTGEEAAFSLLVTRHAGMVQGVAVRCTRDRSLAEEVTQTVFTILVRKARSLQHECLAGWLQRTTFLEAGNARRKAARYQYALSRMADTPSVLPGAQSGPAEEVLNHLDESLARLPARTRHLVVLRFYEGKDLGEIAAETGTNHEACKKQIQRSIHRLGDLLRRKGVMTTSGSLASLLAAECFSAASAPAATIAAAAIKTTPLQLPFLLYLMNTNALLKTSAVVLVLAAIPAAVMWQSKDEAGHAKAMPPVAADSAPRSTPSSLAGQPIGRSSSVRKSALAASSPDDVIAGTAADFSAQIRSVLKGEVSEDEQLAFWQSVKSSEKLDRLIRDLQQSTASDPSDVDSRLSLGLAYVAKIWSMPDGPEKAIWAGKAEGVWKEVIAVAPQNWEAQRNLAFSYSRYPDFLNKSSDAIAEYERTLTLQEAAPSSNKEFANSYLEMARLQLKTGNPGNALATLERGAAAHPDSTLINRQLEEIKRSYNFEPAH